MPTLNSATDMHSGSHSQYTTVTAPSIDQNYVDLSGTRNSGTQIFGLQNLLYVAPGGSVYSHKPLPGEIMIANCNLGPCWKTIYQLWLVTEINYLFMIIQNIMNEWINEFKNESL